MSREFDSGSDSVFRLLLEKDGGGGNINFCGSDFILNIQISSCHFLIK